MGTSEAAQKAVFRPRARILSLLGEQLISDQAVGLIELVKNAYDADATAVYIELSGLRSASSTRVVLRDNGCGMTRDDIEQKWLSPAVSHKEQQKKKKQRTSRGRLPIGEKGVGRFAVQQLGHKLQLISRAADAPEIVVEINWDDFDREDAYLNEIELSLSERSPEIFRADATGTILIIEQARSMWTESLVAKVHRALRRLQSPHRESHNVDFTVTLVCPDFPAYQHIQSSDILERAHYSFDGAVTADGILDYDYRCHHPALPKRAIDKMDYNLLPAAKREMHGDVPSCGPFYVNFYVWDRTPNYLQQSQIARADLDAMAGVSIFRDGLRILPYGESGNDWLELDKDRINNMAERIGNQQIVGYVEILQEQTLALRDKTDRQGLIENEAFRDLRALVRACINVFISHWSQDRPKQEKQGKTQVRENPVEKPLEQARSIVEQVISSTTGNHPVQAAPSSVSSSPQHLETVPYRSDPVPPPVTTRHAPPQSLSGEQAVSAVQATQPVLSNSISPRTIPVPEASPDLEASAPASPLVQVLDLLDAAINDQEITSDSHEQQQQMLMHLAGTGMAAERIVHEFGRQVNAARTLLGELRTTCRGNAVALRTVNSLEACIEILRNEMRVLAPYEAGFRLQRLRSMKIMDPIQTAVTLNKHLLDAATIALEIQGEDFAVAGRPAPLVQVFDNLINNACIWLENQPGTRRIQVILDPTTHTVRVEDNGPGIPEHMRKSVFEAFVSMRNGGRGLGLYITRELLQAMHASIELSTGHAPGASFLLKFHGSTVSSSQK